MSVVLGNFATQVSASGLFLCVCASVIGRATAVKTSRLKFLIGKTKLEKLKIRLQALNQDIAMKGLHDFPGADGKLLAGYAYGEYYDWDLYFENIYLSYYGVSTYDFTNFKVFLDRQRPDGFVSRTIGITYPLPDADVQAKTLELPCLVEMIITQEYLVPNRSNVGN